MTFGLDREQYQFISESVVGPLEAKGARIWCFGSRARGDHQPFSDLDLMVVGSRDFSIEIGQIRELLSKSNFPFKVDLVQLSEFVESYRAQFEREKKLFRTSPD